MHVWVGNNGKKVRYNLADYDADHKKEGGQGIVYFRDNESCLKVVDKPEEHAVQLATIAKILACPAQPYAQVRAAGAVPVDLVRDENNRVIGYTMEQLVGWHGLNEIQTEQDSQELGVDLAEAGMILAALSHAVRLIHSQGFVIGDFNPRNVLFTQDGDQFLAKVIDADSWSIYRQADLGIEYASNVLDTGAIYYPDVIKADRDGQPCPRFTTNHDWWAFAHHAWWILTKYDPYQVGVVDVADREDRVLYNHTAYHASTVKLHPEFGPATQAMGTKLRFYLDRCLKGKDKRPFPTKMLDDFAHNLRRCKCGFTAHTSAIFCPKCAEIL